jgi:hypothetical protein
VLSAIFARASAQIAAGILLGLIGTIAWTDWPERVP